MDYAPAGADLLGQNGGFGWLGPWAAGGFNASQFNSYDIQNGTLTFPNLVTTGNRTQTGFLGAIGGLVRTFATSINADSTDTLYMSVLLRPEGTLHEGAFNGFFGIYLDSPDDGEDIYIGKPGGGATDEYVVEDRGGSDQFATATDAVVGQTALLVLKAQFSAGNDTLSLYVNPTPGAPEPTFADAVKTDADVELFTGVNIYSTGAFSIDEIRLGPLFADVVPVVPEPSGLTLALALSVGLVIAGWRRKR
jgi:hypothetical protein